MHASILKVAGTVVGTAAVVISVSLGATHSSGSAAEPTPALSVAPADEPSAAPVLGQPVTTEAQAVAIAAQDLAMVRRVDSASAVLETLGALRAAGGVLEEQQQADYSDGASGVWEVTMTGQFVGPYDHTPTVYDWAIILVGASDGLIKSGSAGPGEPPAQPR